MDSIEVRVNVPVHREAEFYRWFADWKENEKPDAGRSDSTASLDPALAWWRSLTPKEAAIWSIWVDAAPVMVTADAIVQELGLKGSREIPGAIAWSSRKGKKVGFKVDWRYRTDPATGLSIYGLEDVDYAAVIRQARDESALSAPRGV
ncbi:hypothetical protein [Microbacterium sp. UFMG61]|uniref:hypothetical protein n=1 Tax=Microbacterium sp. UFMG61 TaxID=2745935 RepID=UPI001890802D|nr:hypothetical protein [Microbacterium sp. UFMG61]